MIVTEEEAKTKVCPATIERGAHPEMGFVLVTCMGSECMAWRWAGAHVKPEETIRYGFCGKASKP